MKIYDGNQVREISQDELQKIIDKIVASGEQYVLTPEERLTQLEQLSESQQEDLTDAQLALCELYELLAGGES